MTSSAGLFYERAPFSVVTLGGNSGGGEDALNRCTATLRRLIRDEDDGEHPAGDFCLLLIMQAEFWLAIAEKIRVAERGALDPYRTATAMFEPEEPITREGLVDIFGSLEGLQGATGGLLYDAWHYERLRQLSAIVTACEALCVLDFRDALNAFPMATSSIEERELCQFLAQVFYRDIAPLAFASMWIWKSHVRARRQYQEDHDEMVTVWRVGLQLHAIAHAPSANDRQLRPIDFPCVFARDVSATKTMIVDCPVVDMTLYEFWVTCAALIQRSPALVIGTDYHQLVRLLMWRLAVLASVGADRSTMDLTRHVHIPDASLAFGDGQQQQEEYLSVNDEFMLDTERIFFYVLEAGWAVRYLASHLPVDVLPTGVVFGARDQAVWDMATENTISSDVSAFVRTRIESVGWWRYVYWDELECYMVRTKAPRVVPRQALGEFRSNDCDVVLQTLSGRTTISTLWRAAQDTALKEYAAHDAMVASGVGEAAYARGWCWRMVWDIRREMKLSQRAQGSRHDTPIMHGVRIEVDPMSGDTTYLDARTLRKIRGRALEALEMVNSVTTAAASVVERNIIQEVAAHITVKRMKDHDHDCDAFELVSTYVQKVVRDDPRTNEHLTLTHLLRANPEQHHLFSAATPERPAILCYLNRYYVHDGARAHVVTIHLSEAVFVWCYMVERQVRARLNVLALDLQRDPHTTAQTTLESARTHVSRIPATLRALFALRRDRDTCQADRSGGNGGQEYYRWPDDDDDETACAWDRPVCLSTLIREAPFLLPLRVTAAEAVVVGADEATTILPY